MKGSAVRNPHGLPVKTCAACGRPFTWRRKWALNWDTVRYCSDACRAGKNTLKKPEGKQHG
jgi:hypothetical protein